MILVDAGPLVALIHDDGDLPRMRELMRKYRDLPMDMADAGWSAWLSESGCGAFLLWTAVILKFIVRLGSDVFL